QATIEGAAAMLIATAIVPSADGRAASTLVMALAIALAAHLAILAVEQLTPSPTRHHELAGRAIRRGAVAPFFWGAAVLVGGVVPLAVIAAAPAIQPSRPAVFALVSAVLALGGAFAWEYIWVEAGQSVPVS